jgi:tripartite-type tricarboxylate transporter receptor subunit TctC
MRKGEEIMKTIAAAALAALGTAALAAPATADEVVDFYKGKTTTMLVATPVGGGFNAYARAVAKHIVKHIPGKPTMIVQNMPGSGGRKATAYLYNVSPRDGSVMLGTQPGTLVDPVLGAEQKGGKYNALEFGFIGSASGFSTFCLVGSHVKVDSFQKMQTQQVVFGGDTFGSTTHDHPQLMKNLAGAKIKLVKGYRGTKNLVLAVEQKELDGFCGYAWASLMSRAPHLLRENKIKLVVQFASEPHPEMTKLGVPMVWDFIKDPKKKAAMELFANVQVFGRPYIAPPGVPKARLAALQKAFMETMNDPGFKKDLAKSRLAWSPTPGPKVEQLVRAIYAAPDDVKQMARWALKN